jgi:hypothetical protein
LNKQTSQTDNLGGCHDVVLWRKINSFCRHTVCAY